MSLGANLLSIFVPSYFLTVTKFYDDHYVVTCNEIESSIPFDKLYKIIETDTNYYLMASKVSGTIICKADCPNDFDVYIHDSTLKSGLTLN